MPQKLTLTTEMVTLESLTMLRYYDSRLFDDRQNPCKLVMPYLFSITATDAATPEKLTNMRAHENIMYVPHLKPQDLTSSVVLLRRQYSLHQKPVPLPDVPHFVTAETRLGA